MHYDDVPNFTPLARGGSELYLYYPKLMSRNEFYYEVVSQFPDMEHSNAVYAGHELFASLVNLLERNERLESYLPGQASFVEDVAKHVEAAEAARRAARHVKATNAPQADDDEEEEEDEVITPYTFEILLELAEKYGVNVDRVRQEKDGAQILSVLSVVFDEMDVDGYR